MKIAVVLGSSRQARLGERVCAHVMSAARDLAGAEFTVLDLGTYSLPFFCEPLAPWSNRDRRPAPEARRWLGDVAAADGYLFITPEYNYAIPAVLKNALDYLGHEGDGKPASILSYSDTPHGGNIAGHELRLTLNKLGMLPLPRSLPLAHADRLLDSSGALLPQASPEQQAWAAKVAAFLPWSLNELVRYAAALAPLRASAA
jgi:NAD(P)H-dependent FMN reductase